MAAAYRPFSIAPAFSRQKTSCAIATVVKLARWAKASRVWSFMTCSALFSDTGKFIAALPARYLVNMWIMFCQAEIVCALRPIQHVQRQAPIYSLAFGSCISFGNIYVG